VSLALKLVLAPVLVAQAVATRRRAPVLPEAEGPRQGRVGQGGRALRVLGLSHEISPTTERSSFDRV